MRPSLIHIGCHDTFRIAGRRKEQGSLSIVGFAFRASHPIEFAASFDILTDHSSLAPNKDLILFASQQGTDNPVLELRRYRCQVLIPDGRSTSGSLLRSQFCCLPAGQYRLMIVRTTMRPVCQDMLSQLMVFCSGQLVKRLSRASYILVPQFDVFVVIRLQSLFIGGFIRGQCPVLIGTILRKATFRNLCALLRTQIAKLLPDCIFKVILVI